MSHSLMQVALPRRLVVTYQSIIPLPCYTTHRSASLTLMANMTAKPLLSDLAPTVTHVPSNFVRPIADRPDLQAVQPSDASIPLIDIHGLDGPNRSHIVQQIGQACQDFGLFQVLINSNTQALTSIILLPFICMLLL